MDGAWNVMLPILWLMSVVLYGIIFMAICFVVPPHPRATGRSLLLDFGGCLLAALPTLLILGMVVRFAWNFTVSQPFLIALAGPAFLGLVFGLAYAFWRRAVEKALDENARLGDAGPPASGHNGEEEGRSRRAAHWLGSEEG